MKKILYLTILLASLVFTSCTDLDDNLVLPEADTENIIETNSELYTLIERAVSPETDSTHIGCVEFSYPFSVILYDQNQTPQALHEIYNEDFFVQFLDNLNPQLSLSISYPIQTITDEGTVVTINNNTELRASLLSCEREDIIAECNGIFGSTDEENCVWFVSYTSATGANQYVGGYFEANENGSINFHYDGESYIGTWTFLFVEDDFQLNISLEGTSEAAQYWSRSMPVVLSLTSITLQSDEGVRLLTKNCETTTPYAVGQTGPAGGKVFYDKGSYSEGWRYMEIATTETDSMQWGCNQVSIPLAINTTVGRGFTNSGAIAQYFNSISYSSTPELCSPTANGTVAALRALRDNYKRWFLPTEEEMILAYQNLFLNGQGDFTGAVYWTSTEKDAGNARAIDFTTGQPVDVPKEQSGVFTKAVRYF